MWRSPHARFDPRIRVGADDGLAEEARHSPVAGVIATLVALVNNTSVVALTVAILVLVANQLEGKLLPAGLMGRSVSLHPLVVLVSQAVGGALAGVIGAVLAMPMVSALCQIINVWNGSNLPARWARAKPTRAVEETEDEAALDSDVAARTSSRRHNFEARLLSGRG